MKFTLQELVSYYAEIYKTFTPIAEDKHFFIKPYFTRNFEDFARNNSTLSTNFSSLFELPDFNQINDLDYMQSRSRLRREFIRLCKTSFSHEIIEPLKIEGLNTYFLNESLTCLDRSIYWLLNYYRNRDGFCLNAKIQNLYYSEFFIHLSISRFLGLAYTWISKINLPIKIQIEKIRNDSTKSLNHNMKINVTIRPPIGGMHETTFVQIRNHIKQNIDLPDSEVSLWFEPSFITSLSKNEREEFVYDISVGVNNPWHSAHHSLAEEYNTYCFLDGGKNYYTNDPNGDEYIDNKYRDWGYRDAHIGILVKWMIERLKALNAKRKLKQIKEILEGFDGGLHPDIVREAKSILLNWIN
jgi:hypothetical protein